MNLPAAHGSGGFAYTHPHKAEPWPFGELRPHAYDLIMADPPWPTNLRSSRGYAKSPENHYRTMSFDDIAALPVGKLASKDCILFLWGLWSLLFEGDFTTRTGMVGGPDASYSPIGRIIRAWGFTYCTGGAWIKRTPTGRLTMGTGYRVRGCSEPFFICTVGNPQTSKRNRNIIDGLRREHSQKPVEAYEWCESYFPDAWRLDLFGGDPRQGWDRWAPFDHRNRDAESASDPDANNALDQEREDRNDRNRQRPSP